MEHLFIDTNIYLTFYHFSSDELEELRKLSVAVESKRIKLYVTEQVISEFKRNREAKIADALRRFAAQTLPDQFPQICKAYEEYNELRNILKEFEKTKAELMGKLNSAIEAKQLGADETINALFSAAEILGVDENIIKEARTRVALGNPPGKSNSYGDSINWELLLEKVPYGEDLHLVTDDQDFASKIDKDKLAEFLDWEWREKKDSSIRYYRRLSDFLRSQFPDIRLASELEKELAIFDFISSPNFSGTHLAIKKLSKFADFSDSEIGELIEASIANRQIYWIKDDPDVRAFLLNLIRRKEDVLAPEVLEEFDRIYRPEQKHDVTESDELPF